MNCSSSSSDDDVNDNFDRGAMLENWADNIIVPGYEAYMANLSLLKAAIATFAGGKTTANLQDLQDAWIDAYIAWQYVSMFEIGKAETSSLRDFTNIFPANVNVIESNITNGGYNLELPSTRDQQGFPALDYLLYGLGNNNQEIVDKHVTNDQYTQYTSELVDRLISLTSEVLNDWKGGYRDNFVLNDGSEASSSVNKLVNDYLFYYEKALRAGKIGIPAGIFSTSPLPDRVEALYAGNVSRQLFDAALQATIDFFNGKHYNSATKGESLYTYLNYIRDISDLTDLGKEINDQFIAAQQKATGLNDNFYLQVSEDNQLMLETFDELQKNVVLMKVDMLQAMNISVDYIDADGD
jgi:hypothetical protein